MKLVRVPKSAVQPPPLAGSAARPPQAAQGVLQLGLETSKHGGATTTLCNLWQCSTCGRKASLYPVWTPLVSIRACCRSPSCHALLQGAQLHLLSTLTRR